MISEVICVSDLLSWPVVRWDIHVGRAGLKELLASWHVGNRA